MRKYIILFFSALVILCACHRSPEGIIEEKKMINLLVDVHMADGVLFTTSAAPDSLYKYGTGKFITVFKKYQVDSLQFIKSYKYYAANPELLLSMFDAIGKKLQLKSDSLSKIFIKQNKNKIAYNGKPIPNNKYMADISKNKGVLASLKAYRYSARPFPVSNPTLDSAKKARLPALKKNRQESKFIKRTSVKPDTIKNN